MKTLDDKLAELTPERRSRIAEITRGYETSEYTGRRDHSGLRLDSGTVIPDSGIWAERNGELHVLCRTLLDKYRALAPDDPWVYEADAIICSVPQARLKREE